MVWGGFERKNYWSGLRQQGLRNTMGNGRAVSVFQAETSQRHSRNANFPTDVTRCILVEMHRRFRDTSSMRTSSLSQYVSLMECLNSLLMHLSHLCVQKYAQNLAGGQFRAIPCRSVGFPSSPLPPSSNYIHRNAEAVPPFPTPHSFRFYHNDSGRN